MCEALLFSPFAQKLQKDALQPLTGLCQKSNPVLYTGLKDFYWVSLFWFSFFFFFYLKEISTVLSQDALQMCFYF